MRTIYPKLITALFVVLLIAVLVHGKSFQDKPTRLSTSASKAYTPTR